MLYCLGCLLLSCSLIVGASYVALECAGFLTGLGFDTTVMVRSILLRGFDQQIAENIGTYMAKHGTKFIRPCVPTSVQKLESGKLLVSYNHDGTTGSVRTRAVSFLLINSLIVITISSVLLFIGGIRYRNVGHRERSRDQENWLGQGRS